MPPRPLFLLAGPALLAAPLSAQQAAVGGGETPIELSEVPPAVMEAAREVTGIAFTYAQTEQEPGGLTYEIGGTTEAGLNVEVDVLEDATVEEVEREVASMQEVPFEVRNAVTRAYPGFEPTLIEAAEVVGEVIRYEFEGTADGRGIVVEVTALGEVLDVAGQD